MELETMFVEQKWNILRELSEEPRSPLQLSERLGTSMANISQQLRLLEAANLVQKRKIKNRDKGKPRALFSLTRDHGYIIAATPGFANKQLVTLSEQKRAIMQIWFVQDEELHAPLQQVYWSIYGLRDQVSFIAILETETKAHVVIAAKKTMQKKIEAQVNMVKDGRVAVHVVGIAESEKLIRSLKFSRIHVLHDDASDL